MKKKPKKKKELNIGPHIFIGSIILLHIIFYQIFNYYVFLPIIILGCIILLKFIKRFLFNSFIKLYNKTTD